MAEVLYWKQTDRNLAGTVATNSLHIAMCPPEFQPFQQALQGKSTDATYIIQSYVAKLLQRAGHHLTFLAPDNLQEIVCTDDVQKPTAAAQTWSDQQWFALTHKLTWRLQRWLKIPYLNVFSNFRLFDACLQCLPGHDLVYERNSLYRFGVALACKWLKLPYVLYFEADDIMEHDIMDKPITGLLRWQAKQAARLNLNTADRVIVVSEPLKTHLVTKWHLPAEKIVVFPNVADVQRFRPDEKTRAEVRRTFGLQDEPLVIFVGNFYEWHDVTTLLNAFAQLLTTHPEARLVLVGDGARRQAMMQLATTLGLDQRVHFTGMVAHTEVPRILAAADIAVVPYPVLDTDLWLSPLKLFEYMAAGKAIIASDVGQLKDVIQDGHNGLCVPPEDPTGMAATLRRLIDNPELRTQLGRNARADAVQKHSWEHYIARLEQLYTAVLARHTAN